MRSLRRTVRRAVRRLLVAGVAAGCGWLYLRTGKLEAPGVFLAALVALSGLWRFRPRGHGRAWQRTDRRRPAAAGSRAERLERTETFLYFWRDDATGEIVYIGISNDVDRRIDQHGTDKPWFTTGITMKVEGRFATRSAALDAEESAIKRHRPRFNTVHNRGWVA